MSVHKHKDGRWYVRHRSGGKDLKVYFGRGELARAKAEQYFSELESSRGNGDLVGLSVGEVLEAYHNQHQVEATTANRDFYVIDRVVIPAIGSLSAERLGAKSLNLFVRIRLEAGKALSTIKREIGVIKAAFSWARKQSPPLIFVNPVAGFEMLAARPSDIPFPPSVAEMTAILAHATHYLARAIYLTWYLGMRPGGEVYRLRWSDFDPAWRRMRITSARKGGRAVRFVPIPEGSHLDRLLLEWREADHAEFADLLETIPIVHYRGRTPSGMKQAWRRAKQRAGITRRLRFYDLRHAMATYALEAGADLKATSELLGHAKPNTTMQFYQHVLHSQHIGVVSRIPEIPDTPGPQLVRSGPNRNQKPK